MKLRYYHRHLLIACLISVAALSPTAGAMFYVGREVRDVEKLHNWNWDKFDWPGFLWPVLGLAPLWVTEIAVKVWALWQLWGMI